MNDLQTAYATQHDGADGKSDWIIYNTKKEEIYKLPKGWTEKQVMAAIKLGRKFETISFNQGINFQKEKIPQELKNLRAIIQNLTAEKEFLIKENDKITTEIDKLILKE